MVVFDQDGREGAAQEERMDTSTIDAHDMDSLRTEGEESVMPDVTVKPIKSEDNQHVIAGHIYGQVEEAQIEKFLKEHPPSSDDANRRDIKVSELRRIIPLLIIKLFNVRKDPTQKKVKGMWNERPKNWPSDLPYCDPNNQLKGEKGKPSQKVLLRMFSFLMKNYLESVGLSYPEQELPASPMTHHVTTSGSPVAIASKPYIKMESKDAMVLSTNPVVPRSVTEGDGYNSTTGNLAAAPIQSSSVVTSTVCHAITGVSSTTGIVPEYNKLHALVQSNTKPVKPRTKAPTVRELLPNMLTPQPMQQAIIIKPTAQMLHHLNQATGQSEQGHIVSSQPFQPVPTMPEGQKFFLQSLPMWAQAPVSVVDPAPPIELFTNTTSSSQPLQVKTSTASIPVPASKPSAAFTETTTVNQSESLVMDTDPLSVLSATAAKKKPLPVPTTSKPSQTVPPPASNLQVIQPASSKHEAMETGHATAVNRPVQAEDDWDPFVDLKTQCSKKLKSLEEKGYLDSTNSARLKIIKDLLDKMYMVREHDPEFFISTAHEFVSTLDIIKVTRKVPEAHMTKWKEFEGYCKDRLLNVLRKAYPRYLQLVEQRSFPQYAVRPKAIDAPPPKTSVDMTLPECGPGSTANFEALGITPMTPVTVGTIEQLQQSGELNLRIVHDGEKVNQVNQEVEAIKKDLKSYDSQVLSPATPSVDGQSVLVEPPTPGSTTGKDQLEDLEQVLIEDLGDGPDMVSRPLFVSVADAKTVTPMMNYRSPGNVLSPQVQPEQPSPVHYTTTMQPDDDQPVGVHWSPLNGQPPGLNMDVSGENSIAAELLEGIADHYPFFSERRQSEGISKLAKAYINQLAATKVSNFGDDYDAQIGRATNPSKQDFYNRKVPTVIEEVQNVFEKSDMLGPPPAKKVALKRRSSELVAN